MRKLTNCTKYSAGGYGDPRKGKLSHQNGDIVLGNVCPVILLSHILHLQARPDIAALHCWSYTIAALSANNAYNVTNCNHGGGGERYNLE